MNLLNLHVNGNILNLKEKPVTTSGSVNYDSCVFTFDKQWRNYNRIAVFSIGDSEGYTVSLNDSCTCKIPKECLRQAGLLRIGVVGEGEDGVVISTNIVTHKIIRGANEQELDLLYTDVPNDSNRPVIPSQTFTMMWQDERYAVPDEMVYDDFTDTDDTDIKTYYDATFSSFVNDFPDYVTEEIMGEDMSANLIKTYTFTGTDYDRVILVSANHLGSSTLSLAALSRFFRLLCTDYNKNAYLNFLHSKVKFVVVPIVCPEAFMSQSRVNSNGIAPFVNYDHYWEDSPVADKGDGSFSEPESVVILSMLDFLQEEKISWMFDFESEPMSVTSKKIYYRANDVTQVNKLLSAVSKYDCADSSSITELVGSNAPIATNYATLAYGVKGCTVFWSDYNYSGSITDPIISRYAEFIGNLFAEAAQTDDVHEIYKLRPVIKNVLWKSSGDNDYISVSTQMTPMRISLWKNHFYGKYNISLNGYVTVESDVATTVTVRPVLYQENSLTDDYSHRSTQDIFDVTASVHPGINVIPISSVISCEYSNPLGSYNPSRVAAVVEMKSEQSVNFKGFSYVITAVASDEVNSVEVLSPQGMASDYIQENEIPTFKIEYPEMFYDQI